METALELVGIILEGESLPCIRVSAGRWMIMAQPDALTAYQRAQLWAAGFNVRESHYCREGMVYIIDTFVYRGLWK